MHVRMYVCMFVCMHACMYVCMDVLYIYMHLSKLGSVLHISRTHYLA